MPIDPTNRSVTASLANSYNLPIAPSPASYLREGSTRGGDPSTTLHLHFLVGVL